jgi:signal transduction histidine kinase
VRRLERLSESLLDFARVRGAKRDRVRLHDVVEEAWTLVSIDRQAKSVRCLDEVPEGQMVIGDADRLTQVFVNLLRNGVDALDGGRAASGTGGLIVVRSAEVEEDGRRWVRVVVRDNGPGLDPAVLPRLFEPFASTRLDSHGTGLGLAVAEGIVKEHGGVIIARNAAAPDHGAEFEVVLPANERPEGVDGGAALGTRAGAGVSQERSDP